MREGAVMRYRCPHGHGYQPVTEDPHAEAIKEPRADREVIVHDLACGCALVVETGERIPT